MGCTRRAFVAAASTALLGLAACGQEAPEAQEPVEQEPEEQQATDEEQSEVPDSVSREFERLAIDMSAWRYDADNDVYYQLGVPYCLKPASEDCESLAIFVPGPYFASTEGRNTYTCEIDEKGKVGQFTSATAPIIMPVNPGNLGPQASPTSYGFTGLGNYLSAGCIYVYAGFRGRSAGYESAGGGAYPGGDPWPVVDLKAAVRCLRYNAEVLPGDASRVFTFGFSMGGGVSAVMGASGDSELYLPYLEEIGAATHDVLGQPISDAIFGSASWCPVTSFDTADASYEWMMGQYRDDGTRTEGTWTKLLSNDLAHEWGAYVNELDLRDDNDEPLVLEETAGEIYADGTYYSYLLGLIEKSATEFFSSTRFPYTHTPQHLLNARFPGDPSLQSAGSGAMDVEAVTGDASAQASGAVSEVDMAEGMVEVQSVVYATEEDYVNHLNSDARWFTFNQSKGTVRVSSLADFVRHLRVAAKEVCAFDALDRSTAENQLFGVDEAGSLHFSQMVRDLLEQKRGEYEQAEGWDEAYMQEWTDDLAEIDSLGTDMATRMDMFSPLYYLSEHYEGLGTSAVAPHWRVNTGLFQTDTSLCTEVNLVLALRHCEGVADVSFTPVWGQGHVLAEVAGSAEDNLLSWVTASCEQ